MPYIPSSQSNRPKRRNRGKSIRLRNGKLPSYRSKQSNLHRNNIPQPDGIRQSTNDMPDDRRRLSLHDMLLLCIYERVIN